MNKNTSNINIFNFMFFLHISKLFSIFTQKLLHEKSKQKREWVVYPDVELTLV